MSKIDEIKELVSDIYIDYKNKHDLWDIEEDEISGSIAKVLDLLDEIEIKELKNEKQD